MSAAPKTIDWDDVRARIARQQAALEESFAGKGPWADELLRRRTAELAAGGETAAEADSRLVLVARGAGTAYALEVRHLARILPLPRVAPVPGAPAELLGLIAVGGRVLRLYDLDRLCGEPGGDTAGGFAVTLRGTARPVALRVVAAEAVRPLPVADLRPAEGGELISAVTEGRVALLNVAAVMERIGAAGEP